MHNFVYVSRNEYLPIKRKLEELINLVQDKVRNNFTFSYRFVGSVDRNMVTRDINSNIGYDFDVDLRVNDFEENYSPKDIKHIIMQAFNFYNYQYNYGYCEDSTRVITIKVKDIKNSRILHSCDFAIVYDLNNGLQQYIRFNKEKKSYSWEFRRKGFYYLSEKIKTIIDNNLWLYVRELYLEKKNNNLNPNKNSRSLFAETINEIYDYFCKQYC